MTGSGFLPLQVSHDAIAGLMLTPVYIVEGSQKEQPTRRGVSRKDRLFAIAQEPGRAEGLKRGRQQIAQTLKLRNPQLNLSETIAILRLEAGLSQAELASLLGMAQPNWARFEKQPNNPNFQTIKKLCMALNMPYERVMNAIENTNGVNNV